MISKNNRQNSNFQTLHFLVGSCHTPDAAYSLLCDQLEDREMALGAAKVESVRHELKVEDAKRRARSWIPRRRRAAEADLMELEHAAAITSKVVAAALDEVAFIKGCMARLEPHRKYAHLPLPEAHQEMQREEWRLELQHRAENYLLTQGSVPADHFATMRMHPDFASHILPHVEKVQLAIALGETKLLDVIGEAALPKLLEMK